MSQRRSLRWGAGFALTLAAAAPCAAQVTPLPYDEGPVGLALALRRLPTAGRALYVTAHPTTRTTRSWSSSRAAWACAPRS